MNLAFYYYNRSNKLKIENKKNKKTYTIRLKEYINLKHYNFYLNVLGNNLYFIIHYYLY